MDNIRFFTHDVSVGGAKDLKVYFLTLLKDLFQNTLLLDFLIGLHTFDLWIELIHAFFVLFLGGLIVFSQHQERHRRVHKIFKCVSSAIGFLIFLAVIGYLIDHFFEFFTFIYFEQLLLSIEFSLYLCRFCMCWQHI